MNIDIKINSPSVAGARAALTARTRCNPQTPSVIVSSAVAGADSSSADFGARSCASDGTTASARALRTGSDEPHDSATQGMNLCDFDRTTLTAWLCGRGARGDEATRAAARALRVAFGPERARPPGRAPCTKPDAVSARWNDAALREARVAGNARGPLLELSPDARLALVERVPSDDGSARLLFRAVDDRLIEAVLIPALDRRTRPRTTLCISSQVGCARACAFCETGSTGLERQLAASEIVDQVRLARAMVADEGSAEGDANLISNLVVMGMGEPFDNFDAVLRAVNLLTDDNAFAFAPSRVTVSTVGVADKIPRFYRETRAELAVSLNAPDDDRRGAIMPVNARFDMGRLREAIRSSLPRGRRVLFQYALFAGFNDAPSDADLLAAYVRDVPCRVNVIPANPGPAPNLRAPQAGRVDEFVARLRAQGVVTLIRRPRGRDVGGACGQLAGVRRRSLAVIRDTSSGDDAGGRAAPRVSSRGRGA